MADLKVQSREADEKQASILDRQLNGVSGTGQLKQTSLLAYATTVDLIFIGLSCLSAIIAGALNPLLTVIYGQFAGTFDDFANGSVTSKEATSKTAEFTLFFVYLAIGQFVFTYLTTIGFYYTGEHITRRLRKAYFESIIRQNIAFFDTTGAGSITSRLTTDMNMIQEGLTGKLSLCLSSAATFGSAFVIAFVVYWKLGLILSSTIVAMTISSTIGGAYAVKYTKLSLSSSTKGATIAEEAISSIRHVTASGIQKQLSDRYVPSILSARKEGMKARSSVAVVVAVLNSVPYLSYALSFWMGSRFLVNGSMNVSEIVTMTLAIVIGAWSVGRVAPNAQAFISCIASASGILKAISRTSPLDPFGVGGVDVDTINGDVTFANVGLVYPSRPDATVLKDLSFTIPLHQTTAVVGASGSGKSSIVELLMRFYEPTRGQILFAGHDIQSINLRSLRRQISLVGQEPMLFNTSIFENIRYGLESTADDLSPEETESRVIQAAKSANAHGFISGLPLGYKTPVGEKGLQLSGGQRQRIAIARGLIKNPKLLLLDEATSALDVHSERAVQSALEKAAQGRTTVIIAHRLSTIRHADNIIVLASGNIAEQGSHEELMSKKAYYFRLVEDQRLLNTNEEEKYVGARSHEDDLVEDTNDTLEVSGVVEVKSENTVTPDVTLRAASPAPGALSFLATQKFLATINSPSLALLAFGLVLSVISGLGTPGQSIIFAKLIDVLSLPASAYSTLRHRVDFWALMYLVLGVVILVIWICQGVVLAYCEESAIFRAKRHTFRSILRQEVLFFDQRNHSTGQLMSFLSSSTTDLGGVGGLVLGTILSFCGTIGGGLILSLIIGWKLALVCTSTIPLVAGCGYLRLMMLSLFDQKVKESHNVSINYASEATTAIRTVASLCLEDQILVNYNRMLSEQAAKSLISILQTSALYAASQSITFLCAGLAFWYGGTLVIDHQYSIFQFFVCFASLISGSQTAGIIFSHAPGFSKAMTAAGELKALFDIKPKIDTWEASGHPVPRGKSESRIKFENVTFRYPERPDRVVLKNFNLSIRAGQYVALVGPSGCGKTTIVGLLERFFDPTEGQITLDGQDITQLNVNDYRRMLSLVGQETTLYSGTIKENLVLGAPEDISEDTIISACKKANIYNFIVSLPDGFSTEVGARGTMLSGGQRQRIAIARALLRNTNILLLDEATSSLDSESEKLVQEALDVAVQRRTTIAVAHRLSTIRNADLICVLDHGVLVESGTHSQLIAKRGVYFQMVQTQNLEKTKTR
ncbi:leptomycin efflux transporter [Talaromyces pinophilus]|uniref:Leptomycin efflux transporter n=1 Tax=Talaromyces pinophilus TaxID=128442 RepID=A0A0B8MY26_TALPI|nr:leptomycin efflux transporter [Talaromyces pinophilus]